MNHHLVLPFLILLTSSTSGQISIGPSRQITNYTYLPVDTTAIDLDLDGDLDVITHEEFFGWVRWYLNDGDGNFPEMGEWAPPIDTSLERWETLGYFDYDGDGYLDILGFLEQAGDKTQSICLVQGKGGATFTNSYTKILVSEYDPDTWDGELDPLRVPLQDFDGDGRKDIGFENHIIFLGDAPLAVSQTNVNLSDSDGWDREHPLIDWNNDGMLDLIDVSSAPALTIRLNEGRGRFSREQIIELPLPGPGPFSNMEIDPIKRTGDQGPLEFCLSDEIDDVDYLAVITKAADGSVSVSAAIVEDELLPPGIASAWSWPIRGERLLTSTDHPRGAPEIDVDAYRLVWNGTQLSAELIASGVPSFLLGGREMTSADLDGDGSSDLLVTTFGPDRVNGGATDEIFWLKDSIGGPYDSIRRPIADPSYQQSLHTASDIDRDGLRDLITLQMRRLPIRPGSLVLWTNHNNGASFSPSFLPGENTILSVLKTFELDGSLAQPGGDFTDIDGRVTSQARLASAVAPADSPPKDTVTFSPGVAQPQIVMGLSRCKTILDWKALLTQSPSPTAVTSTTFSRGIF